METYIGGDRIAKATRIGGEERGKEGGAKAHGEKREGTRGRERTKPSSPLDRFVAAAVSSRHQFINNRPTDNRPRGRGETTDVPLQKRIPDSVPSWPTRFTESDSLSA